VKMSGQTSPEASRMSNVSYTRDNAEHSCVKKIKASCSCLHSINDRYLSRSGGQCTLLAQLNIVHNLLRQFSC
jgi:hypothetical protein